MKRSAACRHVLVLLCQPGDASDAESIQSECPRVISSRGTTRRRGSGRLRPGGGAAEAETSPADTLPPGDRRAAPSQGTGEDVEAAEGNQGLHLL